MRVVVSVRLKDGILDTAGREVAARLQSMGYAEVTDVTTSKLITIDFDSGDRANAERRIDQLCKDLLANVSIEDYEIISIE